MNIIPYGDSAMLINFEQVIDPEINKKVISYCEAIEKSEVDGIIFVAPAYCSLTIGFDPLKVTFYQLKKFVEEINPDKLTHDFERTLRVPVCYSDTFALDKVEVCRQTGLDWNEVIKFHCESVYRVYMLGFLPGFVYMGKVSKQLFVTRKEIPRLKVPALSVGLAGYQTGIYPSDAPGGWQIIGQTPLRIFDNRLDQPFMFDPGMKVRFVPINKTEFENMAKGIGDQSFDLESLYDE